MTRFWLWLTFRELWLLVEELWLKLYGVWVKNRNQLYRRGVVGWLAGNASGQCLSLLGAPLGAAQTSTTSKRAVMAGAASALK